MMRPFLLFLFWSFCANPLGLLGQVGEEPLPAATGPETVKQVDSDSLLAFYRASKLESLTKGDTLKAVDWVMKTSEIHSTNGNYSQAYDGFWEALIYSNAIADSTHMDKIYRKLGMLYSIFRRGDKAERYFDLSLEVGKGRSKSTRKRYAGLKDTYYILACHNREQGNYGLAKKYLDSCLMMHSKLSNNTDFPFLDAEHGYIDYHTGKYDEALGLLLPNETFFSSNHPEYLVIFYSFLGGTYAGKEDFDQAEKYYLRSLEYSEHYRSHQNYVPDVYQKLGEIYVQMNKMDLAYYYLQRSKDLSEELFSARSRSNSNILEIKDAYRIENENQKERLKAAKFVELEQNQKILFLKNTVLSISFASLILISGFIVWYLHKRRKSEKAEFLNRQKLSEEKNAEILEFKNKELTTSALQLIHKDELILEIKDKLAELDTPNRSEVNSILTRIKINKNKDWKEFNARFTSVNKIFYKTLSNRFPKLTHRDLRLCALIKLNFTSKEISQLLGISMESVNTSRYRLRKKMALSRTDNLTEFIMRL